MSEQDHEWVSAYLDDEVTPAEQARASRELGRQAEARRRLGCYRLIGEAMRRELPEQLYPGLARRVHQAIVKESSSPPEPSLLEEFWHWIRHPVPLATASSLLVALMAGGLWFYTKEPPVVLVEVDVPVDPMIAKMPESGQAAEAHQQILSYLAAHAEVEPQALMPYTQLVEYDR